MIMEKSIYQFFVFDLDGTVLDTLVDMQVCVNRALMKYGLPQHSLEEYKGFIGNGSVKLIQRAIGNENQDKYAEVFDSYYNDYKTHFMDYTKPFEGIIESLDYAKKKGVLLFIYTNKPQAIATEVIDHCFRKGTFEKVIGIPLGGKTKPDPQAFFDQTKEYGLDFDKACYFGDSDTDILTAKNLGITNMYSVSWGYKTYEYLSNYPIHPKRILKNPYEIMKVVDNQI